MSDWYCASCGAPARPGSILPAAAEGYATGICSGAHQYRTVPPREKVGSPTKEGKVPDRQLARVGMVLLEQPPAPPPAHAGGHARRRASLSLGR